jgi:WD40 repeat protein
LESQIDDIAALTFSPDNKLLALAGTRGLVSIWDIEEAMCPAAAEDHRGTMGYVGLADVPRPTFSADGRLFAESRTDGKPRLWNAETGALRYTLKGQGRPVSDLALSADGRYLAYVSEDTTVCVWDTAAGLLKWALGNSVKSYSLVVFTPDSEHLSSASPGMTFRSWCLKTGREVDASAVSIPAAFGWLASLSSDCKLLAVADDAVVNILDVKSRAIVDTIEPKHFIATLAFSPDNTTLVIQLEDGRLTLYNRLSRVHRMARIDAGISRLGFSHDGRYLVHRDGAYVLDNYSGFNPDIDDMGNCSLSPSVRGGGSSVCESEENSIIPVLRTLYEINNRWLICSGKRLLWLPPEYRPTGTALHNSTVALVPQVGNVLFLTFKFTPDGTFFIPQPFFE